MVNHRSRVLRGFASVLALLLGVTVYVASGGSAATAASSYSETFDGSAAAPEPWQPVDWAVDANNSDMWNGDGLSMDSMPAHHGHDCSAPPATHSISTLDQAVFKCRDHVMTSVAGGYAAAYLTPPTMMDLRSGEAVLRFDVSTARGSGRDWIDVWVTPFGDQLALPLNAWLPPYNGEPQRGVQLKMEGASRFEAYQYTPTRRGTDAQLPVADFAPYEDWLTPSATTRSTFELRLSRTHVSFCMPDHGRCWVNTELAVPLDWDQGVVQLSHHSYNAVKDCSSNCVNSWHWDNVDVEPATPLDIVPAAPRWDVATEGDQTLTLQRPAPEGAMVRFAAVGAISVSFDGGKTYTPAVRRSLDRRAPEHFSSYLQPIPAGTTHITFRGAPDQYISKWMVANVNVLAKDASSPTSTTAAPTTTVAPTTTTAAPTTTTTAAPTTTTTAAPTTTTTAAPTTTTTAAPTTTTSAPATTTTTAPPADSQHARECPAAWTTASGACRVPTPVRDHLLSDLGSRRGQQAVQSLEAWYAQGN